MEIFGIRIQADGMNVAEKAPSTVPGTNARRRADAATRSRGANGAQVVLVVSLRRKGSRECRVFCAPAASHAKQSEHTSVVTTGTPKHSGIPCANGFNGFLRDLPGDRAFLPPSSARCEKQPRQLGTSVGVPKPHDFAVRNNTARLATSLRPSHPVSRFVTKALTSLLPRRDGISIGLLLPKREAKYFCTRHWTRQGKSARGAKGGSRTMPDADGPRPATVENR
jgi:hypothetical protein